MADRLRWLPEAADDLQGIFDYIAPQSPTYAANVLNRIVKAVEDLPRFPRMGRVVPEIEVLELREVIVPPYRVIYREEGEVIKVLAVIHGARLLEKALEGRRLE